MPDTPRCGLPHYTWPETVCTEPAGYYRPNIDPHAGPLIIDGRQPGGCAWDEPATPEPPTPDDDYAQATGHEITCTAGAFPGPFQVWPLARILRDVAVGSGDWTWDEEWADLDQRHAETGYLDTLEQQIRDNGITMPVLIGNDGRLWDGHHRLRIAVRLGIAYVPVEITPAAGTTADDPPASSRAADSLRQRLAEALHQHGMVHLGNDAPGDEYDCCADAVLTALAPELAELADYRNRTTWETTCGTCARLLDASYAETARAETAEAALARVTGELDRADRMLGTDSDTFRTAAGARILGQRIRAALNPPTDTESTP